VRIYVTNEAWHRVLRAMRQGKARRVHTGNETAAAKTSRWSGYVAHRVRGQVCLVFLEMNAATNFFGREGELRKARLVSQGLKDLLV
jgi:hypothetical protein